MTDHTDVSLIICTYNRHELLRQTLESIAQLAVPAELGWEVLVVDNNSTDMTRQVAEEFVHRVPFRYIFEPRQGKTRALNRALLESHGELLCFTDDDVQLADNWLSAFVEAARLHPEAGWFGGPIEPWWPITRPKWLHDESLPALSAFVIVYDLGEQYRWYGPKDDPPAGPSMAVRRTTFERIGGYREDLGPIGNVKGTCDDSELTLRALAQGIGGVYVPQARCRHYVQADRLRAWDFLRYGVGKGANQARMDISCPRWSLWQVASQAVRGLRQAALGHWDRALICSLNVGVELGRRSVQQHRRSIKSVAT